MKKRVTQRSSASSAKPRRVMSDGDIITKRMTFPGLTLATGAGDSIPVTTFTSGYVQSAPASEWASFAARYQQYRVKEIRVSLNAVNPVNTTSITHSTLAVSDHLGSSVPGSYAQLVSDEAMVNHPTTRSFTYVADWTKNPNARLWNPTSAVVPTANQFAISVASDSASSMTTATIYHSLVIEWLVEFRGSQ